MVQEPPSVSLLFLLVFCLPFEPRHPTLDLAGLRFTLLEGLAGVALGILVVADRGRWVTLLRHPPAGIALLWAYVAAHALSTALAPVHQGLALKFTLRMVAAALFATVVAAVPATSHRRLFRVLTLSAGLVALLAILEGLGLSGLDPFLDAFRNGPYHVGAVRRASAGSENPNLAAAVLVYGLVAGMGLLATSSSWERAVPVAALFSAGLLSTYSRGGLAAALLGLLVLVLTLRVRQPALAAAPAAALAALVLTAVGFAVGGLTLGFRVSTGIGGPGHDARYEVREAVLRLSPGERRVVSISAENRGRTTWTETGDFDLISHWFDADHGLVLSRQAVPLARRVPPGESAAFDVSVEAPPPGRYLLVMGLNDGRSGSFESQAIPPAVLPAVVEGQGAARMDPPSPHALPRTSGVSRPELWRTALAMWRAHPLTGVGPDNFRWLRGSYSGARGLARDVIWPANNTYLEAAATTGALGLLAFVGTLLATARASWKAWRNPARNLQASVSGAVLFALTVAIGAHAAVDYFLGFTGHYLFFGLVVGMAASAEVSGRIDSDGPGGAA